MSSQDRSRYPASGFEAFRDALQVHFDSMTRGATHLFDVELNDDELWNLYLDSFPPGTNKIFRTRREYDCSCCRHFMNIMGNVIAIKNGVVTSIWDFTVENPTYQPVLRALSNFVKSKPISGVFISPTKKVGSNRNYESTGNSDAIEWNHFYLELPDRFVRWGPSSIAEIRGHCKATHDVFKRSLEEISEDSIVTVLELIDQNSLYRGEQWEEPLKWFLKSKREYDALSNAQKDVYAWEKSVDVGGSIGRIRNHSIGVLLTDITQGAPLDTAVDLYEKIVAPENYKRSKPIYTRKMLERARARVQELGLMDSLPRRHATLDDITVNNILFANRDASRRISGAADVFDEMARGIPVNPQAFSKVEEVSIDRFLEKVLPGARELEVLFQSRHTANLVSLIAPENKDSKSLFKWDNGFSWAYAGNLTDSSIKENVKSAGGSVDGVLRFSIQWNDIDPDRNDLDAHCIEPGGYEIYYFNKRELSPTGGMLDVDIIDPIQGVPAVENITWTSKSRMKAGTYEFFVRNFSHRGGRSGFRAEVEFDGQIYAFEYNRELGQGENVPVADVTLDRNGQFSIVERIPSNLSTREIWGLATNQFHPVSVVMLSPNYWDGQGIGLKHYFFMIQGCANPESPNGFYNEFLKEELMADRKVFEALGSKMAVRTVDDQLSGLGFASSRRNDLIVRVKGQSERVIRVKF